MLKGTCLTRTLLYLLPQVHSRYVDALKTLYNDYRHMAGETVDLHVGERPNEREMASIRADLERQRARQSELRTKMGVRPESEDFRFRYYGLPDEFVSQSGEQQAVAYNDGPEDGQEGRGEGDGEGDGSERERDRRDALDVSEGSGGEGGKGRKRSRKGVPRNGMPLADPGSESEWEEGEAEKRLAQRKAGGFRPEPNERELDVTLRALSDGARHGVEGGPLSFGVSPAHVSASVSSSSSSSSSGALDAEEDGLGPSRRRSRL